MLINSFPVVILNEEAIIQYLQNYGHGANSKDYELAISVWVKRIYESVVKDDYCIGFELKKNLLNYNAKFNPANSEDVRDVLENVRKEDTLTDFILIKGKPADKPKEGWGFQLKQYGKGIKSNYVEGLIEFINKKGKVDAGEDGLIVVLDADYESIVHDIPIREIRKKIKIPQRSYKKIFILSQNKEYLTIDEVYPGKFHIEMENKFN